MASTMQIKLGEKECLIDDADYELFSKYKWRVTTENYVLTTIKRRTVFLHRLLFGEPAGVVDHINSNPLDNRRCNLRFCSQSQNKFNQGKPKCYSKLASKYKGVFFHKQSNRWIAQIRKNGLRVHLITTDTEEVAGFAYDCAAELIAGKFCRHNKIQLSDIEYMRQIAIKIQSVLQDKNLL
jgi:hypothetical protein